MLKFVYITVVILNCVRHLCIVIVKYYPTGYVLTITYCSLQLLILQPLKSQSKILGHAGFCLNF